MNHPEGNETNEGMVSVPADAHLDQSELAGDAPEPVVEPNAEIERPSFFDTPKADPEPGIHLVIPNQNQEETRRKLNAMPNSDYMASEDGRKLIENIREANFAIPHGGWFSRSMDEAGRYWMQNIPSENGPLFAGTARYHQSEGKKLTGEEAIMKVRAALGMGTIFTIPLYHTGIWVTLKAPSNAALVELNRRMGEEKIRLGRQTHGLAFSNNSVFFAGLLADFALAHIHTSNLIDVDKSWHEIISVLDLPILIWGMAYTVWPNGFLYSRVKINEEVGSHLTEQGLLKLGGLQATDNRALSDRQRSQMAKSRGKTMNLESIRRYQEEFLRGQRRTIEINENLKVELGVPTILEYINNGTAWVNNIVDMVDKAFSLPPGDEKRQDYIKEQGLASNARQFGHWIKAVHVMGEVIDDPEDIDNTLDVISASDDYVATFKAEVQRYTEDSTVSIIAVPRTDYSEKSTTFKKFPNLMAIDPMTVFFILLNQKVQMLQQRD